MNRQLVESKLKALMQAVYTKRMDIIKSNEWNPLVFNQGTFEDDYGNERTRWQDFVEGACQL